MRKVKYIDVGKLSKKEAIKEIKKVYPDFTMPNYNWIVWFIVLFYISVILSSIIW